MSDTFPLAKKIGIVQPAANLDYRYGPWPTVQRALEVTAGLRQLGLTVAISSVSTGAIEYHFKNGIADIDLIVKSVDLSGYLPLSGGSLTGNISTNNIIYAKTGNSDLWNSGYVTYNANSGLDLNARSFVNQNSSDLINVESKVILTSSNWDSVYNNVNLLSGNWESNYSTVCSLSGDWESVYSQVLANSSFWQETYITVQNNSGTTWNYQGTDLKELSGRWESSYTTLNANSSLDLNARSFVNSNSTNILNVNTTVNNTSANWNSVYSHWNSNSASIVAAETFVENNSANINNVLSRVNSTSANWNSVYSHWNSNSASVVAAETFVENNSANINNVLTRVNTTSANWNSVYSAWNNVSGLDLNVRTYVNSNSSNINNVLSRVNTTSANWNSVYSAWNNVSSLDLNVRTYVNSNSSNINNVLSRVNSTSANWNSVYSTYNTNSALYATQQYTADNFLALSGGYVRGDVSIGGNLFLLGTATQISTEDLILTNSLIFLASGNPSDVVDIGFVGYTSGSQNGQRFTGLIRDSFDKKWYLFSQLSSLSGSDVNINSPSLQIDTLKANIEGNLVTNTNVFGNLSASGNIFGENLKIQNWNTAFDYATVYSNNSSKYESVYSNVNLVSGNLNSVYSSWNSNSASIVSAETFVENNSSNIVNINTKVNNTSANWDSVYSSWNLNSADLIDVENFVKNTSANNSVFSTVCAFSANWNSVYSYVNQASGNEANQQNVVSFILSNSSNIINVNTRVNTTSANWNSVYSSWNSNSASIISAETFVENNSANIVNVNTKVNSSSANWDSLYSLTNVTSSRWSNLGSLTATIVTDLAVGAITAAQVLVAGTTFQQFAEALLTRIYYPTFTIRSLGVTSNHGGNGTNVEIGTQSVTLTLTYTRGEIRGKTNNSIWDPNFLQGYRTGTATNYIIFGNTTTLNNATSANALITEGSNTYNVTCNYGTGDQPVDSKNNPYLTADPANSVSTSMTLNGRRRAFFGADTNNFVPTNSNQVRALTQNLLHPQNGSQFTINVASGASRVIIAYPASLQDVTTIFYPPLQSNVKTTFTQTTVSVSAANNLFPTNYRVYYYIPEIPFGSTTSYIITI
jgi:hypothetical protein